MANAAGSWNAAAVVNREKDPYTFSICTRKFPAPKKYNHRPSQSETRFGSKYENWRNWKRIRRDTFGGLNIYI